MSNFMAVFKSWVKDPFGKQKQMDTSRRVLLQMTETKAIVKEAVDRLEPQPPVFPISHMITTNRTTKGRG